MYFLNSIPYNVQRNLVFKRLILFEGLTISYCFVMLVSKKQTHKHM